MTPSRAWSLRANSIAESTSSCIFEPLCFQAFAGWAVSSAMKFQRTAESSRCWFALSPRWGHQIWTSRATPLPTAGSKEEPAPDAPRRSKAAPRRKDESYPKLRWETWPCSPAIRCLSCGVSGINRHPCVWPSVFSFVCSLALHRSVARQPSPFSSLYLRVSQVGRSVRGATALVTSRPIMMEERANLKEARWRRLHCRFPLIAGVCEICFLDKRKVQN